MKPQPLQEVAQEQFIGSLQGREVNPAGSSCLERSMQLTKCVFTVCHRREASS